MIAAALGVLLGVSLTFIAHRASALVTPHDPMRGMVIYGGFMLARMSLAIAALAAYYVAAHDGLAPFGLALGLSFVAGLGYEAVKASSLHAPHSPA